MGVISSQGSWVCNCTVLPSSSSTTGLYQGPVGISGAHDRRSPSANEKSDESKIVDAVHAQEEMVGDEDAARDDKNERRAKADRAAERFAEKAAFRLLENLVRRLAESSPTNSAFRRARKPAMPIPAPRLVSHAGKRFGSGTNTLGIENEGG